MDDLLNTLFLEQEPHILVSLTHQLNRILINSLQSLKKLCQSVAQLQKNN